MNDYIKYLCRLKEGNRKSGVFFIASSKVLDVGDSIDLPDSNDIDKNIPHKIVEKCNMLKPSISPIPFVCFTVELT